MNCGSKISLIITDSGIDFFCLVAVLFGGCFVWWLFCLVAV
jgi:hypothetical protein